MSDGARVRRHAEGDVADAQDGQHAGQLGLDAADALQRLQRAVAQLFLPGGDREGQRVEEQRLRRQAVLVDGDVEDALGDGDLLLDGLGHALLVNRQRDHRRAVLARQRQHRVDAFRARFSRLIELMMARPG